VLRKVLVGLRELEVLEQDLQDTFEACIGGPSVGCSMLGSVVDIFTLSEVVFVFTDIQDSTSMSAFDALAMKCAPERSPNVFSGDASPTKTHAVPPRAGS
jgi:hypothetical protein